MTPDRMELAPGALGFAAATMAAALFALCAIAAAVAPETATTALHRLFDMDHASLVRPFSAGVFVQGLLCVSVGSGLTFAAIGVLYNRFLGRSKTRLGNAGDEAESV
ncbi:MAG: hypothetical protein HY084_11765 [Gemmatimonadetes bacterium]|nr:hypothetical protein [Gemmatimonadota bacterium]